ncbi:MAG: tautomerase family protein [Burkholderiales bacterium]
MPLAQLYIAAGRDEAKKKALIAAVTEAMIKTLGTPPESTWVTVQEIPRSQWGSGGVTLDEKK